MAVSNLSQLQKFQAEARDTPAGGGRSRSTSVGSSQKSLPGAWASPPEKSAACSSKGETRMEIEMADVLDVLGLQQPLAEPLSQLPLFPKVTTTFDDFLSPANSPRGSDASSPVAPPGLTLDPIQSQMAQPAMAFWETLEPAAPMAPGAVYPEATPWPQPNYVASGVPSVGSASHGTGQCKPCAFHHTKGCACGTMCTFCHLCLPGEKKRRQKEKQQAAKVGYLGGEWNTTHLAQL